MHLWFHLSWGFSSSQTASPTLVVLFPFLVFIYNQKSKLSRSHSFLDLSDATILNSCQSLFFQIAKKPNTQGQQLTSSTAKRNCLTWTPAHAQILTDKWWTTIRAKRNCFDSDSFTCSAPQRQMMNNKHLLQSRQAKPSSYDIPSTRWFINTLKDGTWQIQESKFWKHKQEVTKEREKQNWEFTRGKCIQRAMSNATNGCPALPVSANFSGNVCILLAPFPRSVVVT